MTADRASGFEVTAERYLGWGRIAPIVGDKVRPDKAKRYRLARFLPEHHLSYGGEWTVEKERIVAGRDARLRLHFVARDVHIVLSGAGTVRAFVDGTPAGTTRVVKPQLYTLLKLPKVADGMLELRFSPGVSGYAFTFG